MTTRKAARAKQYYVENKKRIDARNAKWQRENREATRQKTARYRARHPATALHRHAEYPEPTRPMPERCEARGCLPNGNGRLHLDHDHITGKFRGWICARCNLGLGSIGDNIDAVRAILAYLERAE